MSRIIAVLKYLNQDMPLEESKGYDDHWDNRKDVNSDIAKLSTNHRKKST